MQMRRLLSRAFPPDATAPGLARRALSELPPGLGPDLADLRLMVSELVTNCIKHAGLAPSDRIGLEIFEMEPGVRVEVRDPGRGYEMATKALRAIPGRPEPHESFALSGFGFMVIAALADRFGARRDGGTVMWFEVDGDHARGEVDGWRGSGDEPPPSIAS
jgi:anti-sigma regulatory factor (Ser/Thr protein kinase)